MLCNIYRCLLLCLMIVFIISCTPTMNFVPKFDKLENISPIVKGKIDYDGNKEYLPRTISDDSSENFILTIKYQYNVDYGGGNVHVANLFNPLVLVGFPIGQDTLIVVGKLDFIKQNKVIKTYSAACSFEKTRSVFYHGPTFSELRKTGLLNVKDNIESQTYKDKELLQKLSSSELFENNSEGGSK